MFVIRRKNYLKQRLVENIKHIKKPKFDDVESLVETDKASFMNKVWPFKTKQVNVQQAVRNQLDYTVLMCFLIISFFIHFFLNTILFFLLNWHWIYLFLCLGFVPIIKVEWQHQSHWNKWQMRFRGPQYSDHRGTQEVNQQFNVLMVIISFISICNQIIYSLLQSTFLEKTLLKRRIKRCQKKFLYLLFDQNLNF